jgi:hypothetical protein
MPDRKSHAHVPILRDPPMIPLCDGLNGGAQSIRTLGRLWRLYKTQDSPLGVIENLTRPVTSLRMPGTEPRLAEALRKRSATEYMAANRAACASQSEIYERKLEIEDTPLKEPFLRYTLNRRVRTNGSDQQG